MSLGTTDSTTHNEIVTLTMDYENRSPSYRSSPLNATNNENNSEFRRQTDSPPPAIFFDEDANARDQRLHWLFPCCYRQEEVNRRAPPSYSTIFPSNRNFGTLEINRNDDAYLYRDHMAVLINNCSSFIAPIPPPSYAQDQGICVAESLEQLITHSASDRVIWSPESTTAVCPRCATLVITLVEMQQATTTHIMAIALFLMGCWPCCMVPYCLDSCKTSHHYCPFCRTYLGTYTP